MMDRVARGTLWFISIAAIVAFVMLVAVRLVCPIELGNGEGMMLDSAIRIARGQPLYVEPTLHFIPFVYMPLFPAMVAGLVHLFGPALWQGRLVDLLGVFGFVVLLIQSVRRETGSGLLATAGAAIFLMGHGLTRGGYDVVRPDPIMLLIAFGGLAVLRFSTGVRGAILGGLISGLAFFAKQHALIFAFGGLAYLLFHDRRRALPYGATMLAVVAGGYAALSGWLGPWFDFYVRDVPTHWSQFSRGRVIAYLGEILTGKFGPLTIPIVMAATIPGTTFRGPEWLWYWVAVAGAGTGLLATLDPYAYYHVLMPTIASLALAGPIALHRLSLRLGASGAARASAVVCLVLALQFLPLLYPMRTLVPRAGAAAAHRDLVERLRALPGPVLLPFHGYYGTLAGKGTGMTVLPLDDVLRARGNRLLRRDPRYFERMFDSLRAGPGRPLIVSDTVFSKCGDASLALWRSLEGSYRLEGDLGSLTERLRPLAGARNAPTWIYAPVDTATLR